MTNKEICEALREMMDKYNEYRAKWIEKNGTDEGFNEWFSKQVEAK